MADQKKVEFVDLSVLIEVFYLVMRLIRLIRLMQ